VMVGLASMPARRRVATSRRGLEGGVIVEDITFSAEAVADVVGVVGGEAAGVAGDGGTATGIEVEGIAGSRVRLIQERTASTVAGEAFTG
jgi:hypothetical protein